MVPGASSCAESKAIKQNSLRAFPGQLKRTWAASLSATSLLPGWDGKGTDTLEGLHGCRTMGLLAHVAMQH